MAGKPVASVSSGAGWPAPIRGRGQRCSAGSRVLNLQALGLKQTSAEYHAVAASQRAQQIIFIYGAVVPHGRSQRRFGDYLGWLCLQRKHQSKNLFRTSGRKPLLHVVNG